MKFICLTDAEYRSLSLIIENGWGDGDFAGYGGENKKIQTSAMSKFNKPYNNMRELKNRKQNNKGK